MNIQTTLEAISPLHYMCWMDVDRLTSLSSLGLGALVCRPITRMQIFKIVSRWWPTKRTGSIRPAATLIKCHKLNPRTKLDWRNVKLPVLDSVPHWVKTVKQQLTDMNPTLQRCFYETFWIRETLIENTWCPGEEMTWKLKGNIGIAPKGLSETVDVRFWYIHALFKFFWWLAIFFFNKYVNVWWGGM